MNKPRRCRGCPFYNRGKGFVTGDGPIRTAKVWIIGQDPGQQEIDNKKPFVEYAPSGRYVGSGLRLAGCRRDAVYVTNARKCLPPKGASEKELAEALAHCRTYLDKEMEYGSPNVILCLGAAAAASVTGRTALIKKWQGAVFRAEELGDELPTEQAN